MSAHPTAVIFGIELPAARWVEAEYLLLQDREKPAASKPGSKSKIEDSVDFRRIRCPLCKWRPTPAHRWFCAQCDYPEFFAMAAAPAGTLSALAAAVRAAAI